jgi:guanylate kinase
MDEKINFIVVSGGSGVGKTTVFNELIRKKETGELSFDVPLKLTTRPLRPSDNPLEIDHISLKEYKEMAKDKRFLIEFERHGHKYGVLRPKKGAQETQLQIIPARDVIPMRDKFEDVNFVIVILNANPDVINERRMLRGDEMSESEAKSREKTVKNKPLDQADFIIDANVSKEAVTQEMTAIVESASRAPQYPTHIQRDDLKEEMEIASQILHIAKEEGINAFLFGGIAANIYGSERDITDLDILIGAQNFDWLLNRYSHPDLVCVKNNKKIEIGRVEISKEPARVGDRSLGQEWFFGKKAENMNNVFINGKEFPLISPEDLIVMKAGLGRGENEGKFDLFDINNIVKKLGFESINWAYVVAKARECNSYERVISSLDSLGIDTSKMN